MEKLLFLPVPRKIRIEKSVCKIPSKPEFCISGIEGSRRSFVAESIRKITKKTAGKAWEQAEKNNAFLLVVCDKKLKIPEQGYKLVISNDSIKIESSDASGAYYGICTLGQILIQKKKSLPSLLIEDYPDFKHRAVMIDISRSKVPELKTLFNLVEMLSSWKINQIQLYTEHTFAYKGHEIVWKGKSPMTPEEIRKLDEFCKEHFVELVPNQNSFGHFHRWLQHPQYRHLAEDPNNPSNLCPIDNRSIKLLEDLYSQLLPNFTSNMFNVGCDETTLGVRSADAVKEKGEGRVYLEFLLKIYNLVKKHGRTMQFWGDIIQKHPELIPELPKDVIVLEWGYESDHPFARRCENIAKTGIPFYVCPGTSSWNSIAGRTENCLANLINASENGIKYGATGFLITDWGDNGHLQYLPVSYIGFGAGAGLSWCLKSNLNMPIEETIGLFAFDDASFNTGYLAYELGNVSTTTGISVSNASPLFLVLIEPILNQKAHRYPITTLWMRKKGIKNAEKQIEKALHYAGKLRIKNNEESLVRNEFENAARLLKHSCKKGMIIIDTYTRGKIPTRNVLKKMIDDVEQIIHEHKKLWLKRNKPGGLEEGVELLRNWTFVSYKQLMDS
ncbi:MAG: family 20 glycosylhydrolase [Candidatus Omnitrophica bacterium]|nr:family 20 glycosylhydrolase [Candidatus Omnitrophota bacterium]